MKSPVGPHWGILSSPASWCRFRLRYPPCFRLLILARAVPRVDRRADLARARGAAPGWDLRKRKRGAGRGSEGEGPARPLPLSGGGERGPPAPAWWRVREAPPPGGGGAGAPAPASGGSARISRARARARGACDCRPPRGQVPSPVLSSAPGRLLPPAGAPRPRWPPTRRGSRLAGLSPLDAAGGRGGRVAARPRPRRRCCVLRRGPTAPARAAQRRAARRVVGRGPGSGALAPAGVRGQRPRVGSSAMRALLCRVQGSREPLEWRASREGVVHRRPTPPGGLARPPAVADAINRPNLLHVAGGLPALPACVTIYTTGAALCMALPGATPGDDSHQAASSPRVVSGARTRPTVGAPGAAAPGGRGAGEGSALPKNRTTRDARGFARGRAPPAPPCLARGVFGGRGHGAPPARRGVLGGRRSPLTPEKRTERRRAKRKEAGPSPTKAIRLFSTHFQLLSRID